MVFELDTVTLNWHLVFSKKPHVAVSFLLSCSEKTATIFPTQILCGGKKSHVAKICGGKKHM